MVRHFGDIDLDELNQHNEMLFRPKQYHQVLNEQFFQ